MTRTEQQKKKTLFKPTPINRIEKRNGTTEKKRETREVEEKRGENAEKELTFVQINRK